MFERLQSFAGLRGPSFAFEAPACAPQNLANPVYGVGVRFRTRPRGFSDDKGWVQEFT